MVASSILPVCECALVSTTQWQVKCSHRSLGYSSTCLTWSIEANLFGTGRAERELLPDCNNKFRYAIRHGVAMKRINRRSIKAVSLFLVIPFLAFGQSSSPADQYEWRSYGADPGGMRYSSLSQINRSNVAQLQRAWTHHTGEIAL